MEFAQAELNAVEVAIEEKKSDDTRELQSLELTLIGGGIGDVAF